MKEEKDLTVEKRKDYEESIYFCKKLIMLQERRGQYMKPYYRLINIYCELKEYLKAINVFEDIKEFIKYEEGCKYNIYSNIKKAYKNEYKK